MDHTKWEIIEAIGANGIFRNFSVLGGEPLAPQNIQMTAEVIDAVRHAYPKITIYLWTGYKFEDLVLHLTPASQYLNELQQIFNNVDVIIDGPFIEELKDLSLKFRGSSNQNVRRKINNTWEIEE